MPTKSTVTKAPATDNRPIHEIRHRNIRATIWRNQTGKGPMYNVTVSRCYRDESGQWHDTSSFAFDDLMNLAKALYDAHSHISEMRSRERVSAKAGVKPGSAKEASTRISTAPF